MIACNTVLGRLQIILVNKEKVSRKNALLVYFYTNSYIRILMYSVRDYISFKLCKCWVSLLLQHDHAHSLNRWRAPKLDRPAVPQLQLLSYEWIITVWGRGSTRSQLPWTHPWIACFVWQTIHINLHKSKRTSVIDSLAKLLSIYCHFIC